MNTKQIKAKLLNTFLWFKENIPIILWVVLLVSLVKFSPFFGYLKNLKDNLFSVVFADIIWSIAIWNPINSYIIAWYIWNIDEKLITITTFLIAWITVGFVQLPAEIYFFWKKFVIVRNLVSFIFAIICWIIVYLLMKTIRWY